MDVKKALDIVDSAQKCTGGDHCGCKSKLEKHAREVAHVLAAEVERLREGLRTGFTGMGRECPGYCGETAETLLQAEPAGELLQVTDFTDEPKPKPKRRGRPSGRFA